MLFRKMLRDMKSSAGQFISVFLLSALAMVIFCTMEGNVLSQKTAREKFHEACNLGNIWVYGEKFTEENLEAVKKLDFVEDAQLRTSATGTAPECDGVQADFYLENEDVVNKPYLIKGEEFDAKDKDGMWLTNAFAEKRNISVGDDFTIEYNGIKITKKVKGLIESPEYEFRQAAADADIYIENIAFVYMSADAFDVPFTQIIIKTNDNKTLSHEKEIAKALDNNYSAMIDRKSVPGLARLDSELEQHKAFSYTFVIIFLGISILVIATSMNRMVEKQRTIIGTMNALGLKKSMILWHYISFSFFVSFLGVIVGTAIGHTFFTPMMTGMFKAWYIVPGASASFQPVYIAVSAFIVLVCVCAAYLSCRKILKIKPAETLRPAPPKSGKKCIFERLPFWNRLSFNCQYNLRDISRAKLRAVMCIIGTAAGMVLMLYGVGCNFLVGIMVDLNFEKVTPADYQVKLESEAPLETIDSISDEYDGELVMTDQIEVSKVKNATTDEKKKETITVLEGKNLYNILDLQNNVINLKNDLKKGEIAISRKCAQDLGIKAGDTIYWHIYSKNEWHEAKVGLIYRCAETQGITYLREDFEKTGVKFTPSLLLTNKKIDKDDYKGTIVSVNSKGQMIKAYESGMEMISILVVMMIVFAIILIVVVLYNSGSLSFNERVKEFATLKVMGLQSSQIRKILSIQNMWLSVIGVIIGAPFGEMSLNVMINSNGDNFDYNLTIPFADYILSAVIVIIVSILVSFMFSKRIKHLDMVEVLKGVE